MLKRQRKIVSVTVVLSLAVAMGGGLAGKSVGAADGYGIGNPVTDSRGVTTWDKVKFGSYYQTAEFTPEPIKWRVLSVDGDDAFLLADESLECKPYHAEPGEATWETCSLRKWLNEDFYNEAFSSSEQAAILETTVITENNSEYSEYGSEGGEGGNDTVDHIYLLSLDEARNADYGLALPSARLSKNTDYSKCKNATSSGAGNGPWWLRSPGINNESASSVEIYGDIDGFGNYVDYYYMTVRPALHLELSSSVYTDAGEIDSKGNVTNRDDGISAPKTDTNGVTTWDCVYLGNYKQTAEWKKEPIEWRVLSVDGDDAVLLADRNLDGKPYHTESEDVTWETCSLRKWLNEDFYKEAFSSSEQAAVGNDMTDGVYLLSLDDAGNKEYGFASDLDVGTETRLSKNTEYAKCNNVYSYTEYNYEEDRYVEDIGDWWLRSPGYNSRYASYVSYIGSVDRDGLEVNDTIVAVRPALHLDLSSSSWSRSGQVRSDGAEVPISGESPSTSESPKPESTPEQTVTTPPQKADPPQATNAPVATASPVPTSNSADTGKLGKVSIKTAKNSKKSAAVLTWKKVNGASGYQIQYALDQKFTKGRKTKASAGTSYTLKKLKKKKTYYIRIRACQKTGSNNVYGVWSKVKKVKIKK